MKLLPCNTGGTNSQAQGATLLPDHDAAELLNELHASLHTTHQALQALLALLHQAQDGATLLAGGLAALLAPVADQLAQAAPLPALLLARLEQQATAPPMRPRRPPHPPASAPPDCVACRHDAQGLVQRT